jgi:uncharacterized membrane protein
MTTVTKHVDVEVPVTTAYNQWTQFESFPRFMEGVESVVQRTDTLTHWRTRIGGVEREFDAQITEQHPDDRVAWISADGKHAGMVTFQPLGPAKTRVTAKIDWQPEGIAERTGALLQADDTRVQGDLDRFKDFVEAHGAEAGWRGEVN